MKGKAKNGHIWQMDAAALLGIGFVLCRYALLGLHGMKQWPGVLAIAGAVALAIAILARKWRLALSVGTGYMLGFLLGQLFHIHGTDPGGGATSNQWIIWTVAFLLCMAAGLVLDIVKSGRA